ncbi:FMN-binding negative transcriptional regulator [Sphingomonas profundi]|uniref:FMN-binding negative transcriptional regulator n=1 Tax=Alterirhizorhabdus profundi TaxID=2681549 RepID=UPI0012E8C8D1|nr:FMN-binding negative transcriptional regulator [Sphingomonas profundi]
MHPDPAFRLGDATACRAFAADRGFAHIFACTADGPIVAHAPVEVTADGRLRFHLARRNRAFAGLDGARGIASIAGPDAYVSPDWYDAPDQVPTWNYVAVEAHGTIRRLPDDALPGQLDAISAAHEVKLAPKPAWTRHKMGPGRFAAMLGAIATFELDVAEWRGTAKLSQNKSATQRAGVIAGLRAIGREDMAALIGADR